MPQAGKLPVRFPDKMDFFSICLILPAALCFRVDSASNKNSTRNLSGGKKRPERMADNLAAICKPNV
jgi:hypothetical protein